MKNVLLGSALLLSVAATPAFAGPNWNQITGTYSSFDIGILDFDGFGVSGTKLLNSNVFVAGSLSTTSEDQTNEDVTFNEISLGLGYRYAVNNTTDIFGVISYEDAEVDSDFSSSESENGYGLKAGVRSMVAPKVEVSANVSYIEIDDLDDVTFSVSGDYYFTKQFSAGVGYSSGYNVFSEAFNEDLDTLSLSATYSF